MKGERGKEKREKKEGRRKRENVWLRVKGKEEGIVWLRVKEKVKKG